MQTVFINLLFLVVLGQADSFQNCENTVKESKYGNGYKIETTYFYKNCVLQYKETEYQDEHRVTYKLEQAAFRKNGNKHWEAVYLSQHLSSYTRYNNEGLLISRKKYTYDFCGELARIDTETSLEKNTQTFETDCQNIYR